MNIRNIFERNTFSSANFKANQQDFVNDSIRDKCRMKQCKNTGPRARKKTNNLHIQHFSSNIYTHTSFVSSDDTTVFIY